MPLRVGTKPILKAYNLHQGYVGYKSVFGPGDDSVNAQGGIITYEGDYVVHTFTDSGTFIVNRAGTVNYLLVGGGGRSSGVGGSAGGDVITGSVYLSDSSYTVTIGAGGSGSQYDGGNTSVTTIGTAYGGEGFHCGPYGTCYCNLAEDKYAGGYNTNYQGACGDGYTYGGGGAGGGSNAPIVGPGGDGLSVVVANRSATYYAGGGGGYYALSSFHSGGLGGGGRGGQGTGDPQDGGAATFYGGGGGGGTNSYATNGNGYQGIVVLWYTLP